MIKFDVRNGWSLEVQFTAEIDCTEDAPNSIKLGLAVVWALKNGANLWGADLRDANLRDANLRDANLRGANLGGANLGGADLWGANLRDANLRGANLRGANLGGADLWGADLRDADLRGANLRGAKGIKGFISFGPVGDCMRHGWAKISDDDEVIVYLGCHCGSLEETCAEIVDKYGENSTYEALVRASVAELIFSQDQNNNAEAA